MRCFLLAWISLHGICLAAESCPWLNAATAAGFLGGAVTVTVAHPGKNPDDVVCTFARPSYELAIRVENMGEIRRGFASYATQCRTNAAPLRAIGNEAVACSLNEKGRLSEQVVGRVRDRAFMVRVSAADPVSPASALRESARRVAEQVAGALF